MSDIRLWSGSVKHRQAASAASWGLGIASAMPFEISYALVARGETVLAEERWVACQSATEWQHARLPASFGPCWKPTRCGCVAVRCPATPTWWRARSQRKCRRGTRTNTTAGFWCMSDHLMSQALSRIQGLSPTAPYVRCCRRVSYAQEGQLFHVLVADGVTFLCMADEARILLRTIPALASASASASARAPAAVQ